MNTLLLSIGWMAALLAQAPDGARPLLDDGAALVQDGGRAARVGVVDVGARRAWVVVPAIVAPEGLRETAPRLLAQAWRCVAAPARVDVRRRVDGSWAFAQDAHRGGGRMLEVLEFPGRLFEDESAQAPEESAQAPEESAQALDEATLAERADFAPDQDPPGRRFLAVDVAGAEGPTTFGDLFAPRLLERAGRLHVVASSLSIEGRDDPLTWIAPLPADGETLAARPIGHGADARLASLRGDTCCIVRALDPGQTLADAAPLHVYWSTDLETWEPGLPVDEETAIADYDLIADLDALWLVGVVPGPPPTVKLWRLDAREGRFLEVPLAVAIESAETRVRLLASTSGAPRPKLVLPTVDGVARVIVLPE